MRYIITLALFGIALIAYVQNPNVAIYDTIQAQQWLEEGIEAKDEGDYPKSIELIEKSIKVFEMYPESKGLGDALNQMYFAYAYNGDWEIASKYSKLHYKYCLDLNISAKETGDALNDVAYIFDVLKEADSTIFYYLKSIASYEQVDTLPSKDLGLAHHNLSTNYQAYGYIEEALIHAKKAYNYWIESEPTVSAYIASMYANMGRLYADLNATDMAKSYLEKSADVSLELEGKDGLGYAIKLANLANFYNEQEQYEAALEYGLKAIKIFEKSNSDENIENLATTYRNTGKTYNDLKEYSKSETAYKKAIELSPKNIASYLNLFALYLDNDRTEKYDDILKEKERLEEITIESKSTYLPLFYTSLAVIYGKKKQFDEAFKYMDYAINATTRQSKTANENHHKTIDIATIQNNENSLKVFSSRFQLIKMYYDYTKNIEDLKLAFHKGLFAIELYENYYKQIPYIQKSKTIETKEAYELVINLAYLLFQETNDATYFEKSFQLSEQFKGNEVLAGLNDIKAKVQLNLPQELLKQEQDIKIKWDYAKTQFFEAKKGTDTDLLDERTKKMTYWQHEYEALMEVFKNKYPNYFDLKYTKANVTIQDVQEQILEPKQVLVEFFVGKQAVYIWQIERNKVSFQKKDQVSDSLKTLVENIRHSITDNNWRIKNPKIAYNDYTSTATQLYQILLNDALDFENHQQLLIVPDGTLNALPFEVLLIDSDKNKQLSYKQLPYLIKNISIAYTPAAKLFLQKYNRTSKHFLAAFAPEYAAFSKQDTTKSKKLATLVRDNEVQLPAALKEVTTISELYNGEAFTHQSATETNFKKKASNYQILHLSMHALIDEEFPLRSHLVFEPISGEEDNQLYLGELYNMNIPADMVVLSACNSGSGQIRTGYGVQSLANAFNYAGTASTIMSLWKVPDQSTAPLMIDFYNELKDKSTKDASLRQAKLNYLDNVVTQELAHPYYWAGFIASGDMSPIKKRKNYKYWWLFGGLAILGLCFVWYRKR